MATIAVFASSLSVTALFVLIKAIDLKYGRKNWLLQTIGKFDTKAVGLVSSLKFRLLQIIQSIRYIILVKSKVVLREWFDGVVNKMIVEYQKRQSVIMGRREIVNRGSVSFYLKKITENKNGEGRGRIEDGL